MKYKGSQCDFKEERDADLLRAYREIQSERDNISQSEIEALLAKSPSSRFWVSEGRAYRVVLDLLKGKTLDAMIPTRRDMYREIYRRYLIYSEKYPSLTTMGIIKLICNENAPRFYITPKSIHVIICRVRKEEIRRCHEHRKRRLQLVSAM